MKEKIINTNSNDKNFYLNILKNNPDDYEAILKLALIDVQENNLSSAKEKFKKLLKINKKKYEGYLNLSNIYSFEGDVLKANNILKDFLNNIEENLEIINAIAINLLNIKKLNDLEIHINKYIDKYNSYILYYLKGYLFVEAGKISKSEEFFQKAIDLGNGHKRLKYFWSGLAVFYSRQKRFDDMLNANEKARKNRIEYATYYNNKSAALVKMNRFLEALELVDKSIELEPSEATLAGIQ